ncbi:hypothetical protein DL93DRAFT_125440 [Clavulina sp. PMI_390]|nr:hypothetical protein DL93DRAFT_125440 [Clavulina sp. PMI_390]
MMRRMVSIPLYFLCSVAFLVSVKAANERAGTCSQSVVDPQSCVDCFFAGLKQWECETGIGGCGAAMCGPSTYNDVINDCGYATTNMQALQTAYNNYCANLQGNQASGPSKGVIAGGVVGGLAGIAVIGVVGAIIFHSKVKAIPALTKLGLVRAGVGASAAAGSVASGGVSHSAGATGMGAAHGAHAGHSGHTVHACHAANGGHSAHARQGANANASAPGMGNGTTVGSASPGTGPAFTPDGGAGHSMGSAGQAPFGTSPDGGISQMAPGLTGGQGAPGGPSFPGHGVNVAPSGSSAPVGASSAGGPGGAGMAPNTSSVSPAATVPYAPPGAIRPSQTSRWRWLGRSRKEIADEEAQRREDERVALAGQMVQVPIVGPITMGGQVVASGTGGIAADPSFPALAPFPPTATTVYPTSAPAHISTEALSTSPMRNSPALPSSSLSSLSTYPTGLSTPAKQNAPLLIVDSPHRASNDFGNFSQGVVLPSTIEYNTPRSRPYARLE